jgi:sterol desaturase/sphingolipid hydroxylase (fatty acid hydroxylase superfamily)/CDGSH-type Zn-finger protein
MPFGSSRFANSIKTILMEWITNFISNNTVMFAILGILAVFGIIETLAGQLKRTKRTTSDWIQEAGGALMLSAFIKPVMVFVIVLLCTWLMPQFQDVLGGLSLWITLPIFLVVDDVLQYWYHRSAHEYDFLWKLHRPHHQAEEMGFFVSYRNAGLYYFLMPNIWWVAFFTFFGAGVAVAIGLVLKQVVIVASHSTVKWDKPFYSSRYLQPVIFVVERIIITPAFHHAHHGKSQIDGISEPNGNFGNMFSIWDQLFGSALFTGQFPTDYGLPNDPKEPWTVAYLWPLVHANNPASELSKGHIKTSTATLEPISVELKAGEKILWCACGRSKNQPYCDGSHHGSKFKPLLFEAKRDASVKLCNCKLTKAQPFCDNSHKKI